MYIILCQLGKLCYIETSLKKLCILTFFIFTLSDLWKRDFIHFITNISIYTGHRHFEDLWSFTLYILLRFVLSLNNSHYAYIPPHMRKALKALGNEKDNSELNFMKNCRVSWFSRGRLKISKCSISLVRLGECSKSKFTPLGAATAVAHLIWSHGVSVASIIWYLLVYYKLFLWIDFK